jgi:hypothetical protein
MHAVFDMHQRCRTVVEANQKVGLDQQVSVQNRGRSDLDYAKDMQTRQSVSGYVIYLEKSPVMHRSAKQKTVALLSCEAELNAAILCVQDML